MNINTLFQFGTTIGIISSFILSMHFKKKLHYNILLRKRERIAITVLVYSSIGGIVMLPSLVIRSDWLSILYTYAGKDIIAINGLTLTLITIIICTQLITQAIRNRKREPLLKTNYLSSVIDVIHSGYSLSLKFLLMSGLFSLGMLVERQQMPAFEIAALFIVVFISYYVLNLTLKEN